MLNISKQPRKAIVFGVIAIFAFIVAVLANAFDVRNGILSLISSPAEVNITTHVSDLSTGASISRAKIILLLEGDSYVEYSDGDGNHTFRVESARGSDARLFVEAPGYEVYDTSIGLLRDQFVDLKLESIDSNNRKIIVRVVDDGTSLPIEGAKVLFVTNGENYSKTTDSNGIAIFTIEFTSETIDVDITVNTSSYEIRHEAVTVRPDQIQDIRLDNSANELSVVPFESSGSPPTGTAGGTIAYDQIISGSITEATQKNRYTFTGTSGDVILITIAKNEGDIWPEIRLLDPEGTEINTVDGPGTSEMDETLLVSGEYIILVGDGFDGTRTGQYTLNLQKIR